MARKLTRRLNKSMATYLSGTVIVVVIILGALLAIGRHLLISYQDPWHTRVAEAGFQEKTVRVNAVELNYVEGPDNGPALLLLHAQHMQWFSYSRVLPDLAQSFHVYAVDYPGHGATVVPGDYPMTANQIGADLADFIARVVGEPAYISGNSSGGLLTAWLASNRPEHVRAILLEDPPLFSAEYPRIRQTIAYRSFITSHDYVQAGASDFLLYWISSNAGFFDNNVFRGAGNLLAYLIKSYRGANPNAPVEIRFLPNDTVRLMIAGLDRYDPRFGDAFFDGSWNDGFDHAETLRRISCPVLLLHADFRTENNTLYGAMNQQEADTATSLLRDGQYLKTDASHVVHLARPEEYVDVLQRFFLLGSHHQKTVGNLMLTDPQ